jgi:hemolysin III
LTVAFALCAASALCIAAFEQKDLTHALAVLIYAESLVITLVTSAIYNLNQDPAVAERLRCCDHAGIFAMIGGTYTPLAVFGLGPDLGAWVLGLMWVAALAGAALKLGCPRRYERTGIAIYLVLGWALWPLLGPLSAAMPASALWLLGGGLAVYSIGVVFHLATRVPYHNVIWHVCVLGGAACQFAAIYGFVDTAA